MEVVAGAKQEGGARPAQTGVASGLPRKGEKAMTIIVTALIAGMIFGEALGGLF